jgi:hypothetical protein
MSTTLIDIAVGATIFALGIALTIRRYCSRDRLALTVVAVLMPLVAIIAVVRVAYLAATNNLRLKPCPEGFEEAERLVERRRQEMFGGKLRDTAMTASWQLAYERELQSETERVQRVALRYLAIA